MKLEATQLRSGRWIVRPEGCLGTCGYIDGKPWTAQIITARNAAEAVRKAKGRCES